MFLDCIKEWGWVFYLFVGWKSLFVVIGKKVIGRICCWLIFWCDMLWVIALWLLMVSDSWVIGSWIRRWIILCVVYVVRVLNLVKLCWYNWVMLLNCILFFLCCWNWVLCWCWCCLVISVVNWMFMLVRLNLYCWLLIVNMCCLVGMIFLIFLL